MAKKNSRDGDRIIIKKYANRRLYNTDSSSYVTLDDLAVMVKSDTDFVVRDAKSGEDITHSVLTQIIFEEESKGETLLPVNFLRQLISFYGDGLQKVVPDYLESSMSAFAQNQEKFRDFFAKGLPGADMSQQAMKPFEEMAKQNMAIFEQTMAQTMSMFSPFGAGRGTTEGEAVHKNTAHQEGAPSEGAASETGVKGDPLADLQAQLAAMQAQLNNLQKK